MLDDSWTNVSTPHSKVDTKIASSFDLFILGIFIVIGGQVFSWNESLKAGYWEAFLGLTLTAFGYLFLVLCLSEMTSALPFSGGVYGFVRVCIGPFFGYVVGCCESLQNIAYVASSVIPLGQMLSLTLDLPKRYEPIYWTFFFVSSITLNIIGGKIFWNFVRVIGIASLVIHILYFAATAQYGVFGRYSDSSISSYAFDGHAFMVYLPVCSWYFIGVESLPLSSNDCRKPGSQIPMGMTACIIVLMIMAFALFFASTSQFPGIETLSEVLLPLNFGYQRVFNLSNRSVTWLAIPATFATGFGFMFAYGRQMSSMARSGLFPPIFKHRTSFSNTPYSALIFGSALALLAMLIVYYIDLSLLKQLFEICVIASYFVYISVLSSYIIFKYRYPSMTRSYVNPLGVVSAMLGIGIFSLGLISLLFFQDSSHNIPVIVFIIFLVICILYYLLYGFKTQQLSEEEQKAMFRAYVINANVFQRGKKTHRKEGKNRSVSISISGKTSSRVLPESRKTNTTHPMTSMLLESGMIETMSHVSEKDITSEELELYSHKDSKNDHDSQHEDRGVLSHPENDDIENNKRAEEIEEIERKHSDLESNINDHLPHSHSHSRYSKLEPFNNEDSPNTTSNRMEPDRFHLGRRLSSTTLVERVRHIANDLKIVPLMDAAHRKDYEELVLLECSVGFGKDRD